MKPQGKLIRPPADSSDLDLLVYDAIAGLDAYGYWVSAKPAPGHEREFWRVIRAALRRLDENYDQAHGTREQRLETLHKWMPEPCWGVQLSPSTCARPDERF